MQSEELNLIDGLFSRLKAAQDNSGSRDASAEQRITQHLQSQPAAPYYMAQTILIQEAAVKQLHGQVQALEAEVARLRDENSRQQKSSGGFLAGLFGGGGKPADTAPGNAGWQNNDARPQNYNAPSQGYNQAPGYGQAPAQGYGQGYNQPAPAAPRASGGGFMAGALQTAAGVAGGMVLGNMLTGLFHQSRPEEIVNIINEPTQVLDPVRNDNPLSDVSASDDLWRDDPQTRNDFANNDTDDFSGDDFGNDFGSDDDNWV